MSSRPSAPPVRPVPRPQVTPTHDERLLSASCRWTWGLVVTLVQSVLYYGVGHTSFTRSTELLRTSFDDAIPFWPFTVWFYTPVYPAILLAALAGFRRRATFDRALRGLGLVIFVALLFHLLVPATYPRPIVHPPFQNLSERFLAAVQTIDPPSNVFPSLHVAHSCSLALFVKRDNPRLGRGLLVMAFVLAVSTLTTKQHFIVDVLSAWALVGAVYAWFVRGWGVARVGG